MFNKQLVYFYLLIFTFFNVNANNCSNNEHYEACGTACPLTCENPNSRPCTEKCTPGCYCNKGFIRDIEINKCVPLEECPGAEPGPCKNTNEEFKECGPVCFATCSQPEQNCKGCKKGCFCKKGFVRDNFLSYKCVPLSTCTADKRVY